MPQINHPLAVIFAWHNWVKPHTLIGH